MKQHSASASILRFLCFEILRPLSLWLRPKSSERNHETEEPLGKWEWSNSAKADPFDFENAKDDKTNFDFIWRFNNEHWTSDWYFKKFDSKNMVILRDYICSFSLSCTRLHRLLIRPGTGRVVVVNPYAFLTFPCGYALHRTCPREWMKIAGLCLVCDVSYTFLGLSQDLSQRGRRRNLTLTRYRIKNLKHHPLHLLTENWGRRFCLYRFSWACFTISDDILANIRRKTNSTLLSLPSERLTKDGSLNRAIIFFRVAYRHDFGAIAQSSFWSQGVFMKPYQRNKLGENFVPARLPRRTWTIFII